MRQPDASPGLDRKISTTWGSVGLLTNPDKVIPVPWLESWARRVLEDNGGSVSDKHLLDERGLLQVPWPELVEGGGSAPLDLLLATTNNPTLTNGSYPTANQIADAWNNQKEGTAEYFRRNRSSGIHTFEDDSIARSLRPDFLQSSFPWT